MSAIRKIVILNANGRSGTTMLQEILCDTYNLWSAAEHISLDGNYDKYIHSVTEVSRATDYVVKYFVEHDFKWHSVDDFKILDPDKIVVSYREDKFDQFLSGIISQNNNYWNGNTKHKYEPFVLSDIQNEVDRFWSNELALKQMIESVSVLYPLEFISYESLLSSNDMNKVTTVKQTTKEEKIKLIVNYNELTEYWRKRTDEEDIADMG